ncbi:MAG: hypothetical protein J6Y02_09995 [Pseudobutyrivibrio sp.]|nr:hypothetical protein [Pseudobutyrivibrio sp.]
MIKSKPSISGRLYPASASLVVDTDKRPGLWDTLQNDPEFWRFDDGNDRLDIKAILFDISDKTADMMKTFIDGSISNELFENRTFAINDDFKITLQIDPVKDNKVSLVFFLIGDYDKYIIHKDVKKGEDDE